jgi:hypothetical protein
MAGIDLDVTAGPLEVVAGLSLELGRMSDRIDADRLAEHRKREQMRARVPMDVRLTASGACPSGSPDFGLNVGGPDNGFYWMVQRLVVGGNNWDSVVAGDATIYVTALTGPLGGLSTTGIAAVQPLSDVVDHSVALPNVAFYSPHQVILQANENLVVVIGEGTAGAQYVATAAIQAFRTIAIGEEFVA